MEPQPNLLLNASFADFNKRKEEMNDRAKERMNSITELHIGLERKQKEFESKYQEAF